MKIVDCIKKFFTRLLKSIKKFFSFIRFIFTIIIKFKKNQSYLFFFFPFYHVGGAERVHIAILSVVKDKKPLVFFTSKSDNDAFLSLFRQNAEIIDIGTFCMKRKYNFITRKFIIHLVNKQKKAVVLGCNNRFFYDIVQSLDTHVKCIDIIHAFSDKELPSAEKWSIPCVDRLDKRIFISNKTIKDLRTQYAKNNIPLKYMERIVYIPNQVNIPQKLPDKSYNDTYNILYVGRATDEKRVHLVAGIAWDCYKINLPVQFNLIGNIKPFLEKEYNEFLSFIGEINDFSQLKRYYENAAIILITSHREGFPIAVMEGMAHGVIPICTNVGDIPFHIKHGKTGYIIRDIDEKKIIKSFVSHIDNLIQNPSLMQSISKNAYLYAKQNFSYERFHNSYKKLLLDT